MSRRVYDKSCALHGSVHFCLTLLHTCIHTPECALSNTLPFVHSWGSFLLSCAAWMQVAALSGYRASSVRAFITAAVHCILAKTQWDVPLTVHWVSFLSPRLPQSPSDTVNDLLVWLSRSATWHRSSYASWHIPHEGPCTASAVTGPQISWHSRGYRVPCLVNRGWIGASTGGGGTTAETL